LWGRISGRGSFGYQEVSLAVVENYNPKSGIRVRGRILDSPSRYTVEGERVYTWPSAEGEFRFKRRSS